MSNPSNAEDGGDRAARLSYLDFIRTIIAMRQRDIGELGTALDNTIDAGDTGPDDVLADRPQVMNLLRDLIRDGTITVQTDDGDEEYIDVEEEDELEVEDEEGEDDVDDVDMDEDDEDELEGLFGYQPIHQPAAAPRSYHPEAVKEPKDEGLKLLYSGEFGRIHHQTRSRNKAGNIAKLLLDRSRSIRPTYKEDIVTDVIPNSDGTAVASYYANAYVGQYSSDSSFYYTCVRDFRLHVYDTTAPIMPTNPSTRSARARHGMLMQDHETSMKVIKTIRARPGGWTITDSHLSPDNQKMIYASVSNIVYMASTLDSSAVQVPINFADRDDRYNYDDNYSIWSCKFSADGNEVIAGGAGFVYVYDLLADKRTVKIMAHADDINSCCWADTSSGNVLISASDDTFLKVWDRRSLGSTQTPSGVLIGHTEGITYVSAKGDGRYVISNGKDQVLRLWDLRMMRSNSEYEEVKRRHYGIPNFDYRRTSYPRPRYKAHPKDCSVMQYTGHEVLRTLIRCHFSPAETTGGQYIYSGGADGRIHIWSLDGRVVQVLDRSRTLPMSHDPSEPDTIGRNQPYKRITVRDVSWHSQQPILMSAGWLGSGWGANESSVIARHEWKGLSKMNYHLEDHVEQQQAERAERAARRTANRAMPGSFRNESDDDDM